VRAKLMNTKSTDEVRQLLAEFAEKKNHEESIEA